MRANGCAWLKYKTVRELHSWHTFFIYMLTVEATAALKEVHSLRLKGLSLKQIYKKARRWGEFDYYGDIPLLNAIAREVGAVAEEYQEVLDILKIDDNLKETLKFSYLLTLS